MSLHLAAHLLHERRIVLCDDCAHLLQSAVHLPRLQLRLLVSELQMRPHHTRISLRKGYCQQIHCFKARQLVEKEVGGVVFVDLELALKVGVLAAPAQQLYERRPVLEEFHLEVLGCFHVRKHRGVAAVSVKEEEVAVREQLQLHEAVAAHREFGSEQLLHQHLVPDPRGHCFVRQLHLQGDSAFKDRLEPA